MSNFDKAIKIILSQPPEPHYPAYYADLLREADVPDKDVGELISRQAAIDIVDDLRACISVDGYWAWVERLKKLPPAQPEPLTDKEQRIFLSAMEREKGVCKQVDDECRNCREPYEVTLVEICHEIIRKVKGVLWTN